MSSEIEAVGAAATAGLAAAAIDGKRGRAHAVDGICANCGANVDGAYCAACGQPAHVHRTLFHMVEEFLHGLLHFDTRAWKTLPMLAFRPGTLTHDYIHGKRARYISPLAMFLLCVFTMFVVFAFSGGARIGVVDPETRIEGAGTGAAIAAEQLAHEGEKATGMERSFYDEISEAVSSGDLLVRTGWPDLDKKIMHKLENPELAVYKVQNAAYKFAFLLVPISLPFLWIMFFWKRGFTLFDHTVYILYSLSFVSLLFIVSALLSYWPAVMSVAAPVLLLAGPVHAYFHLKGGYGLGWFSALWRLPVLIVFAGIGLILFLLAILLLGLVG